MRKEFNNMKESKYGGIQLLRFLSFLCVIVFHSSVLHSINEVFPLGVLVEVAMTFFFIVSGFLYGTRVQNFPNKIQAEDIVIFLKKKIKKVYPLYFLVMLLALPLTNLFSTSEWAEKAYIIKHFIINTFLMQSWFPNNYALCGHTWFLSSLFFLYVITVPLAVALKRLQSRFGNKSLLLIWGAMILFSYIWNKGVLGIGLPPERYIYILPVSRIPEYVCGMVAGIYWEMFEGAITKHRKKWLTWSIAEVAILIVIVLLCIKGVSYWRGQSYVWILPVTTLIGIFTIGGGAISRIGNCGLVNILGNISYECYIIHQLPVAYFVTVSQPEDTIIKTVLLLYIIVIDVLIAYLIYLLRNSCSKQDKNIKNTQIK